MESAIRMAQWTIYAIAALLWAGAVAFVGFRIHQMRTLAVVSAEVLDAGTKSYMSKHYSTDASGWRVETRSRMYSASATVRYEYQGRQYVAEASHDVGVSFQSFQDRLTREWKPGIRINVHLDPARPESPLAGLGFNLNTFSPVFALVIFGTIIGSTGYLLGRLLPLLARFQGAVPGTPR